jgi:hypothetical protein
MVRLRCSWAGETEEGASPLRCDAGSFARGLGEGALPLSGSPTREIWIQTKPRRSSASRVIGVKSAAYVHVRW